MLCCRNVGGLICSLVIAAIGTVQVVDAAGLSTDVALSPPAGGTVVRAQWRYQDFPEIDMQLSVVPFTGAYGFTERLTLIGTVPHIQQHSTSGSSGGGIGDVKLLLKYRFKQIDELGRTTRWSWVGGAEVPSFDEPYSSESVNPVAGTVWTHQRRNWWIDWDLLYKLNTGGGVGGDDELRADTAFSKLLLDGEGGGDPWGIYCILELNARYLTDGSRELLGAPGLQFITSRWIIEIGAQLPLYQMLEAPRAKPDFTAIFGIRYQF